MVAIIAELVLHCIHILTQSNTIWFGVQSLKRENNNNNNKRMNGMHIGYGGTHSVQIVI